MKKIIFCHSIIVAGRACARLATLFCLPMLVATLVSSCIQNSDSELRAVEAEIGRSSLAAYDLHSHVTDLGQYRYEFETPELLQYDNVEEPYIDFPGGLRFVAYTNDGSQVKSRIRCNRARFFKSKNLWELNDDVEAQTEKGDVLNTEQLFWDTEEHRVYSDKFVKISSKGQLITGRGFESDDQLARYVIKRPGGEIEVDD